jgi:hypothetical protein
MIIYPYKVGSRSAKELKLALVRQGVPAWVTQKPRLKSIVVNWGSDNAQGRRVFNKPENIAALRNKLHFFQRVGHVDEVPVWTTDLEEAKKWDRSFARLSLTGSGGVGIVDSGDTPLPQAPLYTRYINKTHEYRVHVGKSAGQPGESVLICVQRKVFKKTLEKPEPKSWAVRNLENGFVFVKHDNIPTPAKVLLTVSEFHVKYFPDVDFCAFDVLYSDKSDRAWVIEGNTAPGLEPSTADLYAAYFKGAM